jgi:hypothetical protein
MATAMLIAQAPQCGYRIGTKEPKAFIFQNLRVLRARKTRLRFFLLFVFNEASMIDKAM